MTRWMVLAGLALAFFGQQPVPETDDVLRLLSERRASLTSLQAEFTQLTITSDEDISSTGTLTYVKPKRIIFRYAEPPIEYMIDQNYAYEYDAELEQILVFDIEGRTESEAFFLGLESNLDVLKKTYTIKALPPLNPTRDVVALELVPIPKEDEEPFFEKVTLQLRKEDYLPVQIDIINGESSSVNFTIKNFTINEALPNEQSHVFVPELTDVILNDKPVEVTDEKGAYFPDNERLGLSEEPVALDVIEPVNTSADE
jgi:outer membrane lipoprotein-sorting protein